MYRETAERLTLLTALAIATLPTVDALAFARDAAAAALQRAHDDGFHAGEAAAQGLIEYEPA